MNREENQQPKTTENLLLSLKETENDEKITQNPLVSPKTGTATSSPTDLTASRSLILNVMLWMRKEALKQLMKDNLATMREAEDRWKAPEERHRKSQRAKSDYL
jgi:hypothetical protein